MNFAEFILIYLFGLKQLTGAIQYPTEYFVPFAIVKTHTALSYIFDLQHLQQIKIKGLTSIFLNAFFSLVSRFFVFLRTRLASKSCFVVGPSS